MTLRHISRRLVISFVTLLSLLGSTFTSYADSTPNEGSTIIYDVYVSGYAITDKNKDSIKFPGIEGRVYYEAESHTLVFENATLKGHDSIGAFVFSKIEDLTIKLIGKNSVVDKGNLTSFVHSENKVTIVGDTLNILLDNDTNYGLYISQLSIKDATITEELTSTQNSVGFLSDSLSISNAKIITIVSGKGQAVVANASRIEIESTDMTIDIDSTASSYGFLCKGDVSVLNSAISGSIVGRGSDSNQLQSLFIQAEGLTLYNSTVDIQTKSKNGGGYIGSNLLLNNSVWNMITPETYNTTAIDVAEIALITNNSKVNIDINSDNISYALQSSLLKCDGSTIHCILKGKQCAVVYTDRAELNNALLQTEVVAQEMANGLQSDVLQISNSKIIEDISTDKEKEEASYDVIAAIFNTLSSTQNMIELNLKGNKCVGLTGKSADFKKDSIIISGKSTSDFMGISVNNNNFNTCNIQANIIANKNVHVSVSDTLISTNNNYQLDGIIGYTSSTGLSSKYLSMDNDHYFASIDSSTTAKSIVANVLEIAKSEINQNLFATKNAIGFNCDSLQIDSCSISQKINSDQQGIGISAKKLNVKESSFTHTTETHKSNYGIYASNGYLDNSNFNIVVDGTSAAAIVSDHLTINKCKAELYGSISAIPNCIPEFTGYDKLNILVNMENAPESATPWDSTISITNFMYVKISDGDVNSLQDTPSDNYYYTIGNTIYSNSGDIQVYSINGQFIGGGERVTVPCTGVYVIKQGLKVTKALVK